jgi:hypothetical protein
MPMSPPASSFTARLLSLALSAAALPGCGEGATPSKPEAKPADRAAPAEAPPKAEPKVAERPSVPEAKGPEAAKPGEAAAPPAAVPDGKIGVPECDEYIEKYATCIMEKVPEPARPHMQEAMELSAKAWREAASGPAKDGVAATCKTALEAARQATESLGCDW